MSQLIDLARAVDALTAAVRIMAANPQQPEGACAATHPLTVPTSPAIAGLSAKPERTLAVPCVFLHGHSGVHRDVNGRTWADPAPATATRTHNSDIWEDEDGWHVSCEHWDCPGRDDVGSEYDAEEWAGRHRAEATAEDAAQP